ncbi:hypothetical protein L9F63_002071 [Diploptera punctata]|uniref:Beta-mannosidase B n=1 Tax=Diploptera punctata TaxID=6984 RepID=A0AAD8A3I7_DIPPU|nr:hypothetical protein L9F63_002071 [Diploptera punctata]
MISKIQLGLILPWFWIQIYSYEILLDHNKNDGTWMVRNENGTYKVAATVPGGIYTDLSVAGILTQDIYYRFNDIEYRWVSKENWTYSRTFEVSEDFLEKQQIFLVFYGIDTIASVYLNDQHIGDCENMFVRYSYNVKSIIHTGTNNIKVKILSPINEAKKRFEKQATNYIVPACVPDEYHGECHVNFLRKMQASFAWDWGPAFPSVGIWKSVVLEAFDIAVLREVMLQTVESNNKWSLYLNVFVETGNQTSNISGNFSASLTTYTNLVTVTKYETLSPYAPGFFNTILLLEIPKSQIQLWWPNGYGDQKLYPLEVVFSNEHNSKSTKTLKVGFRSIQLVQEPVAIGTGLTFYFKVNNVPIFAKGSNWIPSHVLPEKSAEPKRIEYLLESARIANMNMLRVWGGGLYESDLFYQLADEKGLLIWQDFMFACSMYPTDDNFLQSVSTEVTQQVRRLQHHPSIAIWAGNNENEAALRDNWYGTSNDFNRYKQDYITLYVDTIRNITLAQDNVRPFAVSSPSNGIESEEEGYVANNPSSTFYGDIHYYNYISNGWDPDTFKVTRFSSEYGYQSMPSFLSLTEVSIPSDLRLYSEFTRNRQHHPYGYPEIIAEIDYNLQYSHNLNDTEQYPIFIYFSQINQAMSYKTETEFYRRSRNLLTSDGQGLTMGALYWQLNDIWQAPSWASIEFNGKWKILHYFAKDFFAPILVSPYKRADGVLRVDLISDILTDMQCVLNIFVYKWNSLNPIYNISSNHTLNNASVTNAFNHDMKEFLQIAGCGANETTSKCFLYFTLTSLDGEEISPHNFLFPQPLKKLMNFTAPDITVASVSLAPNSQNVFEIELKTDKIALFVWLEAYNIPGHFSSNGFLMVKPNISITFVTKYNVDINKLHEAITIFSLGDYYKE